MQNLGLRGSVAGRLCASRLRLHGVGRPSRVLLIIIYSIINYCGSYIRVPGLREFRFQELAFGVFGRWKFDCSSCLALYMRGFVA